MSGARWKRDNRRQVVATARRAAVTGLSDASEHLLQVANTTVPIEEHILEGSGVASVDPTVLKGAVSYDTPYAVRQHEDMTLRHDEGRRAKWLESALKEETPTLRQVVARGIRGALR